MFAEKAVLPSRRPWGGRRALPRSGVRRTEVPPPPGEDPTAGPARRGPDQDRPRDALEPLAGPEARGFPEPCVRPLSPGRAPADWRPGVGTFFLELQTGEKRAGQLCWPRPSLR